MCYDTCQLLVSNHESEKNFNDFRIDILKTFAIDTNFNEDFFKNSSQEKIVEKLFENCINEYKNKSDKIALTTFPVISNVFNDNTKKFENIVVPFTDGNKTLNVVTNLEEAFNSECHSLINSFEKNISLALIDEAWKEHLRNMDNLKQSVQNAVYEQKDPLLIYKFESFNLFKSMLEKLNSETISFLFKANLPANKSPNLRNHNQTVSNKSFKASRIENSSLSNPNVSNSSNERKFQPVRTGIKIRRNAPCTCGSGKKYKQCCGK